MTRLNSKPRNFLYLNIINYVKTICIMAAAALAGLCLLGSKAAVAEGELTVYCGVPEEWCRATLQAFERKTAIKINMVRKSAGEIYAQVKAEATNPKGDVWFGGTGDTHLQAAEEGLTQEYRSPHLPQLHDWARKQAEQSNYKTVGLFAGALGFGYNNRLMEKAGGKPPQCWADLLDPRFRNEVQTSDPNASGTAYTHMATLVQLMGEDQAFSYMKKLHQNVNQYNKSGAAAAKATALGETLIGITFIDDMLAVLADGSPVTAIAPCEGTGYQIGSMSLIKGARNIENAKTFFDWALTPESQILASAEAKFFHTQSNRNTPPPARAPRLDIKLIDYDFAKFGSTLERKRLLQRWDNEIKNQPR